MTKTDNILQLPTAKTYLYHNRIKLNKKTVNEIINLVYDNLKLTARQTSNLKKRLKVYDRLIKSLPPDKHKLLLKYEELGFRSGDLVLEEAIGFIIENEKEIYDILINQTDV